MCLLKRKGIYTMNIYVGNLQFDVTEDELKELFEPFGQVTEVHQGCADIIGWARR